MAVGEGGPPATARGANGNLPLELTGLVGRRRELAAVKRLMAESRMVTLTGTGGTGKTRLAVRIAAELGRAFPAGVWFVDLSELRESGLLCRESDEPGMSNRDIATTLVISARTAESHTENILTKLGFARPAQIAAWVSRSNE